MYFVFTIVLNLLHALFWALGIVLAHILKQLTQPVGPASLKYGRGQLHVGSISGKKSLPPPLFPSCCILIQYMPGTPSKVKGEMGGFDEVSINQGGSLQLSVQSSARDILLASQQRQRDNVLY